MRRSIQAWKGMEGDHGWLPSLPPLTFEDPNHRFVFSGSVGADLPDPVTQQRIGSAGQKERSEPLAALFGDDSDVVNRSFVEVPSGLADEDDR